VQGRLTQKATKKNRVKVSVQTTSFEISAVQSYALKFHYPIWGVCVSHFSLFIEESPNALPYTWEVCAGDN